MFFLGDGNLMSVGVKNDRAGTGRALVKCKYVLAHGIDASGKCERLQCRRDRLRTEHG